MAKVDELISLYNTAESASSNFRTLFQNTADLIFPHENQITTIQTPGTEKTTSLFDETGVLALQDMVSGLSINLFPPGQRFYNIVMSDKRLNSLESVKRALSLITDISHEKRTNSNFMLQANETLKSICAFGTGNLYSEWIPGVGLNYRDYDIGLYVIMENNQGRVDVMMIKVPYTARQAYQEWGDDAGENVVKFANDEKKQNEIFYFLRIVRPRKNRNPALLDNMNMPFESFDVNVKEKLIVKEGGYEDFPFAVPRWSKSSYEVWGRGQGTFALPSVRMLQTMSKDLIECANKHNNPPLEVLESFDGEVKVFPGATNFVRDIPSIRAIDRNAMGNFPYTKEFVEWKQEQIRKLFFNDIFVQLANLKGDRRTTTEIRERLAEGLQRLGPPVGRLQEEWLNPMVIRDIMLLLRNGELPPLPPEIQGQSFKVEYVGRLAMELKSQQAQGFLKWVGYGAEMEGVFPGVTDNVNYDVGYRRLGETLGVNAEDIATPDEIEQKRKARQEQIEAEQALQAAQVAGQAYGQTTKSPEKNSPAEALMGA